MQGNPAGVFFPMHGSNRRREQIGGILRHIHSGKTKKELIDQLESARDRIAELEERLAEKEQLRKTDHPAHSGGSDDDSPFKNEFDLTTILNAMPVGIFLIDRATHRIVDANRFAARMAGRPVQEIVGRVCHDIVCPALKGECPVTDKGLILERSERRLLLPGGESLPIHKTVVPVEVRGRDLLMESFVDISELKRAEQELRKIGEELKQKVDARSRELQKTNEALERRIKLHEAGEAALARSEALFRGVFENAAAAIVSLTPDGRITRANDITADLLGYPGEGLVGLSLKEIIHPDEYEEALQILTTAMARGKRRWQSERKLIRKDGSPIWGKLNATILRDNRGEVESLLIVGTDITARIEAEKALRESSLELNKSMERLQLIMDNVPALISYVDSSLHYRFINGHYQEMFGRAPHEIVGLHVSDVVGKKTFEEVRKGYEAALRGEMQNFELPYRISGKERILDVTYVPHIFEGEIEGIIILVIDITERKRVEGELKDYSDRLALASRAGGIGVWEWDLVSNELIWDDRMRELYRVEPAETSGAYDDWRRRILPEDLLPAEQALQEAMERGSDFDWEYRILWPDGEIRHIKAAARTLYDERGRPLRMTGANWDVTERRRSEAVLRESEERFRSIFENNHAMMLLIDPATGEIVDANPAAARYYGYSREALTARSIMEINTLSSKEIRKEMELARLEERSYFNFRHRLADGALRDVEVFSGPVETYGRELLYSIVHDVTDRKQMEAKLREMATVDALTGAFNRRYFLERSNEAFARAGRYGESLAILMIDIDYFKAVNDTYGHDAGDEVLRVMAGECASILRQTDIFGRLGGEEFAAALIRAGEEAAADAAERMRAALAEVAVEHEKGTIRFTVSIGVSPMKAGDASVADILKRADIALYQAKRKGRNRVVFFDR